MRINSFLFNAVLLLCLFAFAQSSFAQNKLQQQAFSGHWNLINHEYPFNQNLTTKGIHSNGFEIIYQQYLHQHFNLAVPLKLGAVDYFEADHNNASPETISYMALDALIHFNVLKPDAPISPYLLTGLGLNFEEFKNPSALIPMGLGLKIKLTKHFYISLQSEYRYSFKPLRSGLTHGIGGMFLLNLKNKSKDAINVPLTDQDGDGIPDDKDKCPQIAGVAMYAGCPDSDQDGIPDHKDQCPDTPGIKDNGGCPNHDNDNDFDGIPDDEDECPNSAGPAHFGGCPDMDGDGVSDKDDPCPNVPGLARFNGCPDTDGDGLSDFDDRCPSAIGPLTNMGCPEIDQGDQQVLEFAVQAIVFETSSAILKTESFAVLDQIASILQRNMAYHVNINGHTDNVGDATNNQILSEKRAKSCYEYLSTRGIHRSRMQYKGFGESKPIEKNVTAQGRLKNRRVEFELYVK